MSADRRCGQIGVLRLNNLLAYGLKKVIDCQQRIDRAITSQLWNYDLQNYGFYIGIDFIGCWVYKGHVYSIKWYIVRRTQRRGRSI